MAGVQFHPLTVVEVRPETDDAVSVHFDVPAGLEFVFRFRPGQHLTLRAFIDGEDVRRSYSLWTNASSGKPAVGIKRLPGGAFSTFATTRLKAGDVIESTPPTGDFVVDPDPSFHGTRVAIAAGSGITPIMSQVSTTLDIEPRSHWVVIYGNRTVDSIMFLDELEGLKDRYPDRLQIIHVLSREMGPAPSLSGRIDEERLDWMFDHLVAVEGVAGWYLCGPYGMVDAARAVLERRDVAPASVHDELFFAGPPPATTPEAVPEGPVEVQVTLDGRTSITRMREDEFVLDAAMRVRPDLPYSCKGGMCASCKALVVEGDVTMAKNYALLDSELEAGLVLTCQAKPVSSRLVVDFDRR